MPTSYTAQKLVDSIRLMPLLAPVFNSQVAGYSLEPGLSIVNDAFGYWFGSYFAWKFNEIELQPFYVSSYQQDYASANTNIGWLESGECLDVNNTALPKAQPQLQVVKDLPRASSWVALPPMFFGNMVFQVCWRYNNQLYYGTWGQSAPDPTRGNNPQPGSVYTQPLSLGNQMPFNPITQIQDANGNMLLLTIYGTTGSIAPVLPPSSSPGTTVTDGSCVWTVVDPLGQGFRIWPTPSQSGVVWQFNLRAQAKPPAVFTSLDTLLSPIPDEYFHNFREICIHMAYKYSAEEKIRAMYSETAIQAITQKLLNARMQGDREPENHAFIPVGGVVASPGGTMPVTPGNPFGVGGF